MRPASTTSPASTPRRRFPVIGLVALLVAALGQPGYPSAEDLRLGGTGAGLAGIAILAEAFAGTKPDVVARVVPSLGSGGGIKALLAGALDVAVSARPPKDDESAQGAVAVEFARTPFVFATGTASVNGVGRADLLRIYTGDLVAWPDGTAIRTVLRPKTDSDTLLLRGISEAMSDAVAHAYTRPGVIEATTDQDNADVLERITGSIGTSTLGQIVAEKRQLRALAVDGVEPTLAAAASGAYPFHKVLLLVTRADTSPRAREFVAYVLSPAARPVLERLGYWTPAPRAGR